MELSANIFNDVAINYFRKKLYIRCLIWFWMHLWSTIFQNPSGRLFSLEIILLAVLFYAT